MQAYIALLIICVFIFYLLRSYRAAYWESPAALWIPQIWLLIIVSRAPSFWFMAGPAMSLETIEEGSPFDRNVFTILIVIAAVVILTKRRAQCWNLLQRNAALVSIVAFAAISLIWSDFPFVGLKRWVKELGNLLMVLVVLSDKRPRQAVELIVGRTACILIPMSIVLWRYFPEYGRLYHQKSGELQIIGVTTGKNQLGALLLVAFLFAAWRLINFQRLESDGLRGRTTSTADLVICGLAGWLLLIVNSATSLYLTLAGAAFLLVARNFGRKTRNLAIAWVLAALLATPVLLMIGASREKVDALQGHSQNFWGRVNFWPELVSLSRSSSLLGSGYDTYWLGDTLETLWDRYWWLPKEAHNGYVETYLNVGIIGLGLLMWLILAGLLDSTKEAFLEKGGWGVLRITFIAVATMYNITEAAVKGLSPVWFMLILLGCCGVRQAQTQLNRRSARSNGHLLRRVELNPQSSITAPQHSEWMSKR